MVVLALAILTVAAAPAVAAPPPTLDLAGLQAQLTLHGSVDGYMKTTMSGTAPTNIPVKVLAIVDGFYWGKLIMFESADPAIVDNGGIAAGMSGSPIYVSVAGQDYMIGAVSYGDIFTLRGTGLATPIEYMTTMQGEYAGKASGQAAAVKLDRPVATAAGKVRRIVLGTRQDAAAAADGTEVMHPLVLAQITGASAGTTAYASLAAKLEGAGVTVVSGGAAGAPGVTPDLEPGSPCGITFSSGLYGLYVLGTVTYVDGNDVVIFGHPVFDGASGLPLGIGPIEGTLTGATVQGVWPSTYEPYKMMSPADAKGVATQDRPYGMLAKLGSSAAMFPITTHVSVDGGAPVGDQTDLGQWFAVQYWPELMSEWDGESYGATSMVASAGLYHGLGSDPLVGSAETTTTVVVNDGAQDYTLTRSNIWDNNANDTWMGLADAAAGDVTTLLAHALTDPYDTRDVSVKSVDVVAGFSAARRYAGLTDTTIARAIRWGVNTVDVTYYRTGSTDPQTLHATLDVPAGTDLSGTVVAMSATAWNQYYSDYGFGSDGSASAPETMAQTKAIVDALPTNSDVVVAYIPNSAYEDDYVYGPEPAAEAAVSGDWVFDGDVEKDTATVLVRSRKMVGYGAPFPLYGYVRGAKSGTAVSIYCQEAGSPEPVDPTIVLKAEHNGGMATFGTTLGRFRHNVLVTAEVGALSSSTLPGADQMLVKVRALASLRVTRKGGHLALTARIAPADTKGKVVFQRLVRGRWLAAGADSVSGGVARVGIQARGVTRVRARFAGGSANAASAWATQVIH